MQLIYQDYAFPAGVLRFLRDGDTGRVSLILLPPYKTETRFEARREWLQVPELVKIGMDHAAWEVGSLVHLALRHHPQGNGAGNTLKYGASTAALQFKAQEQVGDAIVTTLESPEGYQVIHRIAPKGGAFAVTTEFINHTGREVTLDLLTSFSLDNLSPYSTADGQHLKLHRFRGGWSMEGRHMEDNVEDLNLACPWTYAFPESERFGVLGSHPVKRYFPVCAVEDESQQVFWGASLAIASSWQMELSRDSDCYSLSGGIADCEFGSWQRNVPDGGHFTAPEAYLAVASDLDSVCDHLTSVYHEAADQGPESEQSLPLIFNEWCTTWGNPSHDRMLALADRLAGSPVKYLVIDAGWTDVIPNSFGQGGNGDWNYARDRFPGGLLNTSRALREKGFVTGIWFEFEVTTRGARVYGHEYDPMHLKRNGEVIVTGDGRSFWDFRNPDTVAYLKGKVLDFLRDNEIGYLKVDYNGSIGIGCDGTESVGSGLYDQIQAVLAFFRLLRTELPHLVLECCASGGHRLVATFLACSAMSSFSDAHEGKEIPVLAARLHRLILPRQSQIWAVLNPDHDERELHYRLSSGFLGRLCLSGSIDGLTPEQMAIVTKAMTLYEKNTDIIKYGFTRMQGVDQENIRHLHGWQAALRQNEKKLLIVVHSFDAAPGEVEIALPAGRWTLEDTLNDALTYQIKDDHLHIGTMQAYHGTVVTLKKMEDQ